MEVGFAGGRGIECANRLGRRDNNVCEGWGVGFVKRCEKTRFGIILIGVVEAGSLERHEVIARLAAIVLKRCLFWRKVLDSVEV